MTDAGQDTATAIRTAVAKAAGFDEPGVVSCAELVDLDAVLNRLRRRSPGDPVRRVAERTVTAFVREGRSRRKKEQREADREAVTAADRLTAEATATGAAGRPDDVPLTAPGTAGTYRRPQMCYVCKALFQRADAFYHRLCPGCAADNSARGGTRAPTCAAGARC